MRVGLVEYNEGDEFSEVFMKTVMAEAGDVSFNQKKAPNLIDVIAFVKQVSDDCDQLVVMAELTESNDAENQAFYKGLADFEAETGRNIFKHIYKYGGTDEKDVIEFAQRFLDFVYKRKRESPQEEEDEFLGDATPGTGVEGEEEFSEEEPLI